MSNYHLSIIFTNIIVCFVFFIFVFTDICQHEQGLTLLMQDPLNICDKIQDPNWQLLLNKGCYGCQGFCFSVCLFLSC